MRERDRTSLLRAPHAWLLGLVAGLTGAILMLFARISIPPDPLGAVVVASSSTRRRRSSS